MLYGSEYSPTCVEDTPPKKWQQSTPCRGLWRRGKEANRDEEGLELDQEVLAMLDICRIGQALCQHFHHVLSASTLAQLHDAVSHHVAQPELLGVNVAGTLRVD